MTKSSRAGALATLLFLIAQDPAFAREVVDMTGRTVTVPDKIERVFAAVSTTTTILMSLAPERLVGSYLSRDPRVDRFLPPAAVALPFMEVIGVQGLNIEKVAAAAPQVAISLNTPAASSKTRTEMDRVGVPLIEVNAERLEDYPAAFRLVGKALDLNDRADAWATWIEGALARLKAAREAIPEGERTRVYYSESPDGLSTQCADAARIEVLPLAGARNVVPCSGPTGMGVVATINPETLIALNPEVIVVRFRQAAETFRRDPRYSDVRAVRDGRILIIPDVPFNWVDRPPSHFRLLGAFWLMERLYPDRPRPDLKAETRAFMKLFLNVDLSDPDLAVMLGEAG